MSDNKTWHLATDEKELEFTDIELRLWRTHYGFIRWQEKCEKLANGIDLSYDELAVLHVIGMMEIPKTVYDIGLILNRDDIHNIQYNIKKLLKNGFIDKEVSSKHKKQYQYFLTAKGLNDISRYTKLRKQILMKAFLQTRKEFSVPKSDELDNLRKLYDEASVAVSLYRVPEE